MQNSALITVSIQLEALKNRIEKNKVNAKELTKDLQEIEKQVNEIKDACFAQLGIVDGTFAKYELSELLEVVAEAFSFDADELKGSGRQKDLVFARSVFCRTARKMGYTLEIIAEAVGRTNHTSALNLIKDNAFRQRLSMMPMKEMYIKTINRIESRVFANR